MILRGENVIKKIYFQQSVAKGIRAADCGAFGVLSPSPQELAWTATAHG
ncbi:MAG: hypothetical protein ACJAUP_000311 [Cellvibrionaceae bacterium]|jgi:hypothetical protein